MDNNSFPIPRYANRPPEGLWAEWRKTAQGPVDSHEALLYTAYAIAYYRQQRQWTQGELAEALGCSDTLISQFEAGKKTPSLAQLVALAKALGCYQRSLVSPE